MKTILYFIAVLFMATLSPWVKNASGPSLPIDVVMAVNVKDFGAVGDGSFDDTQAIQTSIDDSDLPLGT